MSEPRVYPLYFECESIDEEKLKKIRNYFQIQRKSGGGDCSQIINLSNNVYKVDFKDKQAQERVLKKREHKLEVGGTSLVLTVRDSPGSTTAASPTSSAAPPPKYRHSSSTSSLPSGGEEHEVKFELYLLRYLSDCAQARDALDRALQPLQSSATLYPEKETALVKSIVSFDDAEAATTWKTTVDLVFEDIKSLYDCHFVSEAKLRLLLLKSCNMCKEEDEDVRVYSESELVIVVGTPFKVKARLKHATDSHSRIRGASLGQRHSRKHKIDKAKYCLLEKEINQSLAKDVPNLQVSEAEEGQLHFEGTVEDIRKACDIIDKKEGMVKECTVSNLSKHYMTFLTKTFSSGQQLCDVLGCGEGVIIEIKATKIKILALSDHKIEQTVKALKETFKEVQIEVPYFDVPVELQSALKDRESIINETTHKVYTKFTGNSVILIGHVREVKVLHGVVTEYILEHSNIEDRVVVPFPELAPKLPELLMLNGFDFADVRFYPLHSGVVALEGPRSSVSQVRSRLEPFLKSLAKENLVVEVPGAQRYFKTPNIGEKLLNVAGSHKCLIHLEDVTAVSEQEEVVARYILKQGVQVIVYLGDITKQEADALVNAANKELKHGGGVAAALSKAAGPEVQTESSNLVKNKGKLSTGDVVVTSGGNLKCKKLLHAVGPIKDKAQGRERELLEKTVRSALDLAECMYFCSIVLPCISAGIFGVPIDVCAEATVSAVKAFSAVGGRFLTKITLIDNRREVVQALRAQCDRLLQSEAAGDTEGAGSLEPQTEAATGGPQESVGVEIVQGTIEKQQVDCIVCPMLGHQPMSTRLGKALHSVAGEALLTKFNESSGGATQHGDFVLVEGVPGLLSKAVVFLNLMAYSNQQQKEAQKVLRESIAFALVICESRGFSSITFPVTGPGVVLQFPHNMAALALLQEIQAFEQGRAVKTPFQIRIVIHPSDKEASKAFQAAQQTVHLKGFTNDANPKNTSFYRHVSSANSEVTALMGSVRVQLVQGDIIHEKTDMIVNSTGFTNEPAGVCKAILTAAGPNVQAELKKAGVPADHICTTGAGLLGCKEIAHVQTDQDPQATSKTCQKVLKLCESKGYTSVAFPAINTGAGIGKMNYSVVGKAMLDGMASAITSLSLKSLSVIRIVILQQPVFDAFKTELENRFGQVAPQNWKGKLKNLLTKSSRSVVIIPTIKPQPVVFTVIGPSSDAITSLKKALEGLVQQQFMEREFELRELCLLDEMEVEAVQHRARSFGVSLDHSTRGNTGAAQSESRNRANSGEKIVILRGLKEDVLRVADLINKAIKKCLRDNLQEKKERDLAQSVQWMYHKEGEDWENFPLHENFLLELAHEQNDVFIKMKIKEIKVKVNLKSLDATDCKTGETYRVRRCEMDTDIEFPGCWNPMAGDKFKKVELDPNSLEYQKIAEGFHKTAKNKIHKIERVQNHYLWCSYFMMRRKMEVKNGAAEVGEKHLYHGTSAESCHCIERDRFNRSYTGEHGAVYGAGVYFAVNALYSTNPRYSKPDSNGLKRMYVARVLTGRHVQGRSSMKAPPQRGNDPSDKYDSLVDNMQTPEIFVIFHDDQAYPEYLITFS